MSGFCRLNPRSEGRDGDAKKKDAEHALNGVSFQNQKTKEVEEMLLLCQCLRKSPLAILGSVLAFIFVMTLSAESGFAQGNLIRGRALYGANCASCHGESGKGDGLRAAELQQKPIDFTDPQVMGAITPQKFEKSVVQGLPNIPEHTFGHLLRPEEVRDVTTFVRSLLR